MPSFTYGRIEKPLRRTPIYETHKKLGAKMIPFAGWEMPVWYTSVVEEHLAVRQAAGLFDVAHMGVYQAEGPDAQRLPGQRGGQRYRRLEGGRILLYPFARLRMPR